MNIVGEKVVRWYKKENITMPWRKTFEPYNIWISEIMLQQTQVHTAIPYYARWINKFPNIKVLSKAQIDQVLKIWEGLGYYKRAHNIYDSSKIIIKTYNGKIPKTYVELISLKGIGDYTASAILSIAYNKPHPVVDGNIKRVFSRLFSIKQPLKIIQKAKKEMLLYMSDSQPRDVNQALMDFGREICSPQLPKCDLCILNQSCKAYVNNEVFKYPPKNKVKIKPTYNVIVGLIWKNNKLLISKRKKEKLLGGLWELPGGKKNNNEQTTACLKREIFEELDIHIDIKQRFGSIKHQYSHFNINLIGYCCDYKKGRAKPLSSDEIKWITLKQIKNFAFPKSTLKLFNLYENNYRNNT